MPNIKAVSAPGKVLVAGGYLVLDRAHTGLVFGLDARMTVLAQSLETSQGVELNEIIVKSPQFQDAQWRYGYHLASDDGGVKVTQLQIGNTLVENKFVETTLSYALTYLGRRSPYAPNHSFPPSRITILADNDYYSHGIGTATVGGLIQNPHNPNHLHGSHHAHSGRFQAFATTIAGAHKTGLGSSAALVTSLVGALLAFYLPSDEFDITGNPDHRRILHNLAQAAHCAAQGKVGSGFDVAAAVYGSCLYRRFSPFNIANIPRPGDPGFGSAVHSAVTSRWDTEVTKGASANLPLGLALRMADVDCGSSTVNMVKKVLAWRSSEPEESARIWGQLQKANDELARFLQLPELKKHEIRSAIGDVRALLREMGVAADVQIEPLSQTALLDAVGMVEGVIGGVVPGAGGFDALALLLQDDYSTGKRVENFFAQWRHDTGTTVKLLKVKGEVEGARLEADLEQYRGWI